MLRLVMADHSDERELVERAKAGDRSALGELLTRHGPSLYRHVLLPRLGSDASAKDALSETYEKVVEQIGRFEWQGKGIYPWLRTIAFRVAIDQIRGRKRLTLFSPEAIERELDDTEADSSPESRLLKERDRAHARKAVTEALARLNPRYAEAIRLRVLEERPRDVVAAELGVSVATFDVLLHRSLAALKKALSSGGSNDGG